MTLQKDVHMHGRTDRQGYNNIPTFSLKSAGIMSRMICQKGFFYSYFFIQHYVWDIY